MSKPRKTKKPIQSAKKGPSPQKRKSLDEGQRRHVRNLADLIDKWVQYIVSGKGIPVGIMLVVMVLVVIQDNWAGRLQTWLGWFWAVQKCFFLMLLYLIYCASHRGCRLIKKRNDQATKKEP